MGPAGAEALFHRHQAALYRFCLSFLSHDDEAADVVQTVWERALRTFSRGDGTVLNVRPWLYTVARHECLDVMRKRGAQQTIDVSDVELAGGVAPDQSLEQRVELQTLLVDLAA
ncbi:MAG TPA: RNA polymerase sigma factor, partial [Solirubrobacteraceae bacterium]|nr:RNA polymerase sigma factor [Solirubrobacteraceae bacterium]